MSRTRADENWKRWGPYLSERQWARFAKIIHLTEIAGTIFRTIMRGAARIAGAKTDCLDLRSAMPPLFRARALERKRSDFEGATLRSDRVGRQPRRGRKGALFYLDSTPTHSYMKALYKYPQAEYPYARLIEENRRRGLGAPELELIDTGVLMKIATSMSSPNTRRLPRMTF